jgi:hypothetical protein
MEELQVDKTELQPLQKEEELSSMSGGMVAGGGGGISGEGYSSATRNTNTAQVPRINILGMKAATGGGGSGQFEGKGGDGFDLAPGGGDKSVKGAVDQFAVITINSVARGKTLVALLIDQSRSIIYGDLPRLIDRMDHYFDEIDKNLPKQFMDNNARWVIVSFGREAKFKCQPSNDLQFVKTALRDVNIDTSGIENVGLATQVVLDKYGESDYKNILIAALTDESGNDIKDPRLLEQLVMRMRNKKVQFFVFGYESTFCAQSKYIEMRLDEAAMKLMRGPDRDAMRGFEGQVTWGFSDGGPESPRPELWWGENWWQWQHWGGSLHDIPSGFGMYGLNRMVLSTGGIYFLLRPESHYDEDKLYAKYKPDICSILTYEQRMQSNPLRRELNAIWHEMGTFYLDYHFTQPEQVQRCIQKSMAGREYCIARARRLQDVLKETKPEGDNWTRWEAQGDLTLAELLRLRFMLGQYHDVLVKGWDTCRHVIPDKQWGTMYHGKVPDDFVGPIQAKQEYDRALEMIDRVIEKHKSTPWELAGQRLKGRVVPWVFKIEDIPKGGPSPPSLQY